MIYDFKEKYTCPAVQAIDPDAGKNKISISNDQYAICEILEELKKTIETLRYTISKARVF